MKKLTIAAALAATTVLAAPAQADDLAGKIQVKVMATGVLPDGKITKVTNDPLTLTPGANTEANDNVVPTIAVEYFASDNISIETICCVTKHKVAGTGTLAGTALVKDVLIVPATVTVKYHVPLGPIKPYVGVGPTMFIMLDAKPDTTTTGLGVDDVDLSSNVGVAIQGGVDIAMGEGMGLSLDAKKYWVSTTAKFYAAGTNVLETKHKLDPWVVSGGIYFRF
ncbi:MAG TPA: OmpW family outer membrane protein [Novosphingobium sp.]|nr:OmpW family outer membrane protein [Novosphingobium sp.]HQA17150.1 OmpW family outer membrane protein [Novosphingobium sp.]